jgi:phage host-nuclease inhibitor protein Gam
METQTQSKAVKTPEEVIRGLKRENKRLVREVLDVKEALERYKQDVGVLTKHVSMLESIILDLVDAHYGEKVRVDFTKFELCIEQRCTRFTEYDEFLIALRVLRLLAQ